MLFDQIDIKDSNFFTVNLDAFTTLDDYFSQYRDVFLLLCNLGSENKYSLNKQFMPFLCIFRHTVELFLKKEGATLITHNINDLVQEVPSIDSNFFLTELSVLSCNSEGDCFRYLSVNKGPIFLDKQEKLALSAVNYFLSVIGEKQLIESPKMIHEFTFHTNEVNHLGQIVTQFGFTISFLVEKINNGEIQAKEVCCPLLYLIRHYMELQAKDNMMTLLENQYKNKMNKKKWHSLEHLHTDQLSSYFKQALKNCNDSDLSSRIQTDLQNVNTIIKYIEQLDKDSLRFRFPYDQNGNCWNTKSQTYNIADLYIKLSDVDPLLTFGMGSFFEQGILSPNT